MNNCRSVGGKLAVEHRDTRGLAIPETVAGGRVSGRFLAKRRVWPIMTLVELWSASLLGRNPVSRPVEGLMRGSRHFLLAILTICLVPTLVVATTTLELEKSFIEANKDRATLTTTFLVDKAHDKPKPAKEDGDIWPEHGGDHEFKQGTSASPAKNTNPDHIFEMHLLTVFDGVQVGDSVGTISGYQYKGADDAFHCCENARFQLECGPCS